MTCTSVSNECVTNSLEFCSDRICLFPNFILADLSDLPQPNSFSTHLKLNPTSSVTLGQARRKQFRGGPAKIGSSAKGTSTLGGLGACSPGKFWNLASPKRTFGALSGNAHARDSRHVEKCRKTDNRKPFIVLRLCIYSLYKQNISWDYLLSLPSIADEILIISKLSVAIFLLEDVALGLLLNILLILKSSQSFIKLKEKLWSSSKAGPVPPGLH